MEQHILRLLLGRDVKIQDLKDSLGLKILNVLYIILYIYNLKNSLKFKIVGILEEIDSYY